MTYSEHNETRIAALRTFLALFHRRVLEHGPTHAHTHSDTLTHTHDIWITGRYRLATGALQVQAHSVAACDQRSLVLTTGR